MGPQADLVDSNAETKNQNQDDSDNTNNSAESNPYEDIEPIVEEGNDAMRKVKKLKPNYLKKYLMSKNEVENRQESEEIVESDNGQPIGNRGEIGDPNDGLFSGIDNVGFVREPRDLGELGDEHPTNNFMQMSVNLDENIDINNSDKENREILNNIVGDEISIIEFD